MKCRCLVVFLISTWALWDCQHARSEDHMLAGESLDWLRDAIMNKHVVLKKLTLASEILNNKLAALFVPSLQPTDPGYVRKCFRSSTALVRVDVEAADLERLHKFAEDDLPQVVMGIYTNWRDGTKRATAINALRQKLDRIPKEERDAAERFAGSLLAELEPKETPLAASVAKYRSFMEAEAKEVLKEPTIAKQLQRGTPYSFGTTAISPLKLQSIRPGDVQSLKVEGKEYKKVWLGKSLVVVEPFSIGVLDPTDPHHLTTGEFKYGGLLKLPLESWSNPQK